MESVEQRVIEILERFDAIGSNAYHNTKIRESRLFSFVKDRGLMRYRHVYGI